MDGKYGFCFVVRDYHVWAARWHPANQDMTFDFDNLESTWEA